MSYQIDMENVVIGRNNATNFGAWLLRLILKADFHNLELLRKGFPNAVRTVEHWRRESNIPDLPYD